MYNFLEKNNQYIVSGLYYKKQPPHEPLIIAMKEENGGLKFAFPFENKDPPKNAVIKVGCVPCGFLLVKREVFERIEPPWFIWAAPEISKAVKGFDMPPGDDVYFSWKARKAGFDLWVDTRADLLHYAPRFVGRKELIEKFIEEHPSVQVETVRKKISELKENADRTVQRLG